MQDGLAQLGSDVRKRRNELGLSQEQLARKAHVGETYISHIEKGRRLPTDEVGRGLDRALSTGQRFVTAIRLERRARQLRKIDDAGPADVHNGGVEETDRRDLLKIGAMAAAGAVQRIARADPDPLTLDVLEADVQQVAADYRTTDHDVLIPEIMGMWEQVEAILETRVSGQVRKRLTLVAGQSAFYLGTLAFDTGRNSEARTYLALANQHAVDVGDPLLLGSVATMRSSVAYFAGAHTTAADIASQAIPHAHPFTLPILAGCHARAAAVAGRPDDARRALDLLQNHVWTGTGVLPGPNPGDPAFAHGFLAVTFAHLGDGEQAEEHALHGLQLEHPDHFVQVSGKLHALARTYLYRPRPEPEAAAAAASRALTIVSDHPTATVVQRVGETHREMAARWPDLAAVRELGGQLRELPPPPAPRGAIGA